MAFRNDFGFSDLLLRRRGGLGARVPEDLFATDDQIGERHGQPVRSPGIDQAIALWHDARESDDPDGMVQAARQIVAETTGTFRMQGVPVYAHPVLPPQFVQMEAARIGSQPTHAQSSLLNDVLDKFDHSAKPGAAQQLTARLSSRASSAMSLAMADRQEGQKTEASARVWASGGGVGDKPYDPLSPQAQCDGDRRMIGTLNWGLGDVRRQRQYANALLQGLWERYRTDEMERDDLLRKINELRSYQSPPDIIGPRLRPPGRRIPGNQEILLEIVEEFIKEGDKELAKMGGERLRHETITRLEARVAEIDRRMREQSGRIERQKQEIAQLWQKEQDTQRGIQEQTRDYERACGPLNWRG